jgi:cell division protein FtsQ
MTAWSGVRWLCIAVMGACAWLLYWFCTDDRFFVNTILVEGNSTIPADEIAQAALVRHWNIFFLSQREIEARINSIEGVKNANAGLEWPNTVRVQVVERQPLFVWQLTARAGSWWVDESGRMFPVRSISLTLPVVRDLDNQPRTQLDVRLVAALQTLMTELPNVKQLEYSTTKGLSFQSERGWRVFFGQPEQLNAKLTLLNALTLQLTTQKITPEYVDVRLPERAFYKPK